jgi:hypothetical protein
MYNLAFLSAVCTLGPVFLEDNVNSEYQRKIMEDDFIPLMDYDLSVNC